MQLVSSTVHLVKYSSLVLVPELLLNCLCHFFRRYSSYKDLLCWYFLTIIFLTKKFCQRGFTSQLQKLVLVYLVWNCEPFLFLLMGKILPGKYQTNFSDVWCLLSSLKMLLVHARRLSSGLFFPITDTNMLLEPTAATLLS